MIREKYDMTEHDALKIKAGIAIKELQRCLANGGGKDAKASIKALLKKHADK